MRDFFANDKVTEASLNVRHVVAEVRTVGPWSTVECEQGIKVFHEEGVALPVEVNMVAKLGLELQHVSLQSDITGFPADVKDSGSGKISFGFDNGFVEALVTGVLGFSVLLAIILDGDDLGEDTLLPDHVAELCW